MKWNYIFLLIFFLIDCNSPESTLLKYLYYTKNNKLYKVYFLLSSEDKELISYEEFIQQEISNFDKLLKKNTFYKIKEKVLSETKQRAKISVDIYQPDLILLFAYFPALTKSDITENEISKITRSIKIKEYLRIYNQEFNLIKEDGKWKVFIDYGRKKRVKELENLAKERYENDEYEESLNIVNKLLEFESYNKIGQELLIKNNEKIQFIKNFIKLDYYIEKNKILVKVKNIGNIIVKRLTIEIKYNTKNEIITLIGENKGKKYIEVEEEYTTFIDVPLIDFYLFIKGIDF